jgi:hypothetical protein
VTDSVNFVDVKFNIHVIAPQVNQSPRFTAQVSDTLAYVDSLYHSQLKVLDPDGDTVRYYLISHPSWLGVDSLTGYVSGRPHLSDSGSHQVIAVVADLQGGYDTTRFNLRVIPPQVNQSPRFTSVVSDTLAYVDSLYQCQFQATDPDGDTLKYTLLQAPLFLKVDSSTGRIWGRPGIGDSGSHPVCGLVSDGHGGTDTTRFILKVDRLTGVEEIPGNIPTQFSLSQNYPNPFNPLTNIEFSLPNSEFVRLAVYDLLGREVVTLVSERKSPGVYSVDFNGLGLPSGVYIYRLQTGGGFTQTKKMVLMK